MIICTVKYKLLRGRSHIRKFIQKALAVGATFHLALCNESPFSPTPVSSRLYLLILSKLRPSLGRILIKAACP